MKSLKYQISYFQSLPLSDFDPPSSTQTTLVTCFSRFPQENLISKISVILNFALQVNPRETRK